MDPKIVESELRTQKIRQGIIYKRTKFLQEWRERWMVLTTNYILVFTNKNLKELTEYVDLRDVKSYKSYVRKDDEMIPAGFKIRTLEDMYYFCARNCNQKWTWMVSLERLMDFKCSGKSPYNNAQFIKTKGFMSQVEFQNGKFDDPTPPSKSQNSEVSSSTSKPTEQDIQKLAKYLQQRIPKLHEKEEAMALKEKQQEEIFNSELKKLKESEEYVKGLRLQYEQKIREADQRVKLAEAKTKQVLDMLEHESKGNTEKLIEITKPIIDTNVISTIETSAIPEKSLDNVDKPKDTVQQHPIATSQPNRNYFIGPISVNFIKYVEEVVNQPIIPPIQQTIISRQPLRLYFIGSVSVNFIKYVEEVVTQPIIPLIQQPIIKKQPIRLYFIGPVSVETLQSFKVIDEPVEHINQNIKQALISSEPIRVYFIGPLTVQTENQIQWLVSKSEEKQEREQEIVAEIPLISKEISKGSRVAQIKKMYQNKITEENIRTSTTPLLKTYSVIKEQKKSKDEFLHHCRQNVVVNLFEQFHAQAYTYTGLKPILQFLVQMTADRGLGYQQYVVSQCKAHENRFFFAETLLELIADYHDYEKSDKLCKVIEVIIFEAPGIFKANHFDLIKRKLIDLFDHSPKEPQVSVVLKTMHTVHQFKKFTQDEELKVKLQKFIAGQQSAESKVLAKKLLEDQ